MFNSTRFNLEWSVRLKSVTFMPAV